MINWLKYLFFKKRKQIKFIKQRKDRAILIEAYLNKTNKWLTAKEINILLFNGKERAGVYNCLARMQKAKMVQVKNIKNRKRYHRVDQ